jgi:Protein of unknown function (DUF2009)
MTGEPTPAERLAAALAAAAQPDDGDAVADGELAAAAAAEEARRRKFDAILATSNAAWAKEGDAAVLRDALVAILSEIRGPALDTVGVLGVSAAEAAAAAAAEEAASSDTRLANGEGRIAGEDDVGRALEDAMADDHDDAGDAEVAVGVRAGNTADFRERAKYIPLRLTPKERRLLRLLEGALNVSQYTDVVDVLSYSRMRTKQRIHSQILDLCSVLSGLMVASDYAAGQELVTNRDFAANNVFFQRVFEIGRRHKIANPEKMRSTYGKLVFLLQDSQTEDIARMLDFSCVMPLRTVGWFLEANDAGALLDDPLVATATQEIVADGQSRPAIQRQIRDKERAVDILARRYATDRVSADNIRTCLYSIGDNNSYLTAARDPCEDLIRLLNTYFGPNADRTDKASSLAIRAGRGGAKLTHDHTRQYQYCLQSLTLYELLLSTNFRLSLSSDCVVNTC